MENNRIIPQGEYLVGVDIPVGRYNFHGISEYATLIKENEDNCDCYSLNADNNPDCHLYLSDGDLIKILGKISIGKAMQLEID